MKRIFIPLSTEPYFWFLNGSKTIELRRRRKQFSDNNIVIGREVELRHGYSNKESSLWGSIINFYQGSSYDEIFNQINYKKVIPNAKSLDDAIKTATNILGEDIRREYVAIEINLKPFQHIHMDEEYKSLIINAKKHSTICYGKRPYQIGLVKIVFTKSVIERYITEINYFTFKHLKDVDIKRDGFETKEELWNALKNNYSELNVNSILTVIKFKEV